MAAPYEQDVILDADGQPIFTALERVRRQVKQINDNVVATAALLNKQMVNMGTMLELQSKEAQQRMAQISALAKANNNPGFMIQDTTQRKKLGQMTTAATEYARGLETAGTAVEGFQTRLNRLNDAVAARGRLSKGETLTQTRQRKAYEEQSRAVLDLERSLEKLQKRAGRTAVGPGDRGAAQGVAQRVADTRSALLNAVRDPSRSSFLPEIGRFETATREMEGFYDTLRTKQAQRLVDERSNAKALERAEVSSMNARQKQEASMWEARDRARKADGIGSTKRRKDEEAAWRTQEYTNKELLAAEGKKAKYLADNTENLKRQTQQRLKLSEAEKLGMEEAARMNYGGNTGTEARQLRTKQNAAELDDMKALGKERAKELTQISAVNTARAQSASRLNELRAARRAATNPADHDYLTRQIKGEQAYTVALRQRRIELERAANAEARQNAQGAGTGRPQGRSAIGNILSPGYLGAAVARTSVYGAGAMAAYGAFGAVQGGLQYVVELEDGLARLQAIANATDGQMVQLKGSILEVGQNSRFSTIELVKISQNLAQAGVTASQMGEALDAVVALANASGSTPDESVNLVTAALGAFQLQATEAARVADLMVTALNRTRLTVAQAGAAIQYVGATAYEQNITLEELMATAAAMSQAGIKSGSTIGTGLRQFLVDLQSPTDKLKESFDALGLTTADLDVTTRGLPAVLDTLSGAGFGAAQAYEGLETRAAAAYLVLKNNVGLIDELRLEMTQQGAAAAANEQAMDSLSAQWQRFKNILNEKLAEDQVGFFALLKDSVEALSNSLSENSQELEINQRRMAGWQGYVDRSGGNKLGATLNYLNDNLLPDMAKTLILTRDGEEMFDRYVLSIDRSREGLHDLDMQMKETSESIDSQVGVIGELDKEYQRLLVQKASLQDNDIRAQTEMVSLTSRFSELGQYLDITKGQYESLTSAVWDYINASQATLAGDFAVQASQNRQLRRVARGSANSVYTKLASDPITLSQNLTSAEMQAFQLLKTKGAGTQEFGRATAILASAGDRLTDAGNPLGAQLLALTKSMRDMSTAFSAEARARRQAEAALAGGTTWGTSSRSALEQAEAALTEARALRGDEQKAKLAEFNRFISTAEKALEAVTPTSKEEMFYTSQQAEIKSLRQSAKALTTPTKSDRDAAERERKAAERERKADRMIQFGPPLANMSVNSGMGMRNGREHKGVDLKGSTGDAVMVTADGVVKTVSYEKDGYGNYIVVDHGGGTETRYAHLSRRDVVQGQQVKKGDVIGAVGSTGKSTGPHLHYEVRQKGAPVNPLEGRYMANPDFSEDAERYEEQEERERERFQKALDSRRVKLAEKDLKLAIDRAAEATTNEAFAQALAGAEASLAELEKSLREQAVNELAAQGLGPLDPEYQDRLDQLEEDIRQRGEEYRQKAVDSIFSSVENAFAAAEAATADVLAEYDRAVQLAQARVSGLGYASMEGKVPDYMRQLAERKVSKLEEARDLERFTLLPNEIGAKESELAEARANLGMLNLGTTEYQAASMQVDELARSIRELRAEQEALSAALTAGQDMPQTLADGLTKAIDAYKEYHNLNRTLKEEVIFNMGGALEQLHSSINTFFTDVYTGSKSVLTAFGDMAMGILKYLQQMAAQFVANQIFGMLLKFAGAALGPSADTGGGDWDNWSSMTGPFAYRGGKVAGGEHNPIQRLYGGGKVGGGTRAYDSTLAMLAKDEWVVNRSAVDSVGDDFMSDLNKRGKMAVRDAAQSPMQMFQMPKQETNVFVVKPEDRPSLGPDDVLVVMREDMVNGETRKLIRSISQGG